MGPEAHLVWRSAYVWKPAPCVVAAVLGAQEEPCQMGKPGPFSSKVKGEWSKLTETPGLEDTDLDGPPF